MINNTKIKIRLQGHEKFALREGWLNKGLIVVKHNPSVFQGKEGPDVFGIGNNMVKSLRYWLRVFGLIEESPNKGASLSKMGELILEKDPYFEDSFTLWVLHSYIAKNIEEATSWYMFFNKCDAEDLEKEQIEQILLREITKYAMGITFSEKSVKSDLDVLLNMYSKTKQAIDPEDKSVSPFAQLNLIKNLEGRYSKNHPDHRMISEWNVLYELAVILEESDSISIEKAVSGEGGLSRLYQITTVVVNELLDKLDVLEYIRVDRTAGLDMIYRAKEFTAESVMKEYYEK
ncbi:MAG: DUF4007 family protein [Mobilitalea sp.]